MPSIVHPPSGLSTGRRWIWPHTAVMRPSGSVAYMVRFRAEFAAAKGDITTLPLSITADSRYRLFINGVLLSIGPLKPTNSTWFVDTVDLAPSLRPGANVVGVEVLAYPDASSGNVSVRRSGAPALSVEGGLPGLVDFADERTWRCSPALGRTFLQGINTVFLGIQERVNASLEPGRWLDAGFADAGWVVPVQICRAGDDPARVTQPRPIPPMTMVPIGFAGISRLRGEEDPGWARLVERQSVTIKPHMRVEVDLDAGVLTTAFLTLELSGGHGSSIELTAAECYEHEPLEVPWLRRKGDRTDAVNGDLYGDPDSYVVDGGGSPTSPETYAPFWFRTFRYLRVTVETGPCPLTLERLSLTETHYPLAITGSFRSSSRLHGRLWETSVRTLQNCMHETFEDCPFYEQLQYAMDTRSQALFSLHLSTDDRLVRRAIADFALSGDPHGLTESRAPSIQRQFIPAFSLFWVFMLAEHLDHVGDREFTRQFLDRMHEVLGFFDALLGDDGLITSPPERPASDSRAQLWNFVDWTDAWRTTRGVPSRGQRGASTILTFQYVVALASAERIARACGETDAVADYRGRAARSLSRLSEGPAWDPQTGYFRDSDTGVPASQHAQVWAVLAGAVTGAAARDLLTRAAHDPNLAQCSYAMSHSLFDAARIAGAHDLVDWKPWQDMLDLNLTTWAEDTVSSRSDCHGWGSVPLQHFPRWVLGVSPLSPGFASARIDPAPTSLEFAEGSVPTPLGPILVRWEQRTPGMLSVVARGPAPIDLVLSERSRHVNRSIEGDEQIVTFEHLVETPGARAMALGDAGERGQCA